MKTRFFIIIVVCMIASLPFGISYGEELPPCASTREACQDPPVCNNTMWECSNAEEVFVTTHDTSPSYALDFSMRLDSVFVAVPIMLGVIATILVVSHLILKKKNIPSRPYVQLIAAAIMLFIGVPNLSNGIKLLEMFAVHEHLQTADVSQGFIPIFAIGLALTGMGIVLLYRSQLVKKISKKIQTCLLIAIAVFLALPWFWGFSIGFSSEVLSDGITVSAFIVMTVTLTFSLISWGLFAWASKKFSLTGVLLGVISGAALVIPFLGVLGPMAGVIVGIIAGFVAFMFQKHIHDASNRPIAIAITTLVAAYLVLFVVVLSAQSPHIWDTGDGVGAWSGTAEGMEEKGFENIFGNSIGFEFFAYVIPSLIIVVLIIRGECKK